MPYSGLLRSGDWLLLLVGLVICIGSFPLFWQGGRADYAIIRQNGEIVAQPALNTAQNITVIGPLGPTQIAIAAGRARVVADPGARQYCVLQGWLVHPGEIAICAPNRVSLQLAGRTSSYDSLSY